MSTDRLFFTAAKGVAYAIIWVAAAAIIFRFGVASLMGSASDMGLLGAVALAAIGVLALAYLALVMVRDLRRGLNEPDAKKESQP